MNRRRFLAMARALGLGAPAAAALAACAGTPAGATTVGRVTVIGAGAAGLTTGYLLQQLGIPFTILEAAAQPGGRMKRTADFVDFPVPLGAEWIHVDTDILEEIVNDDTVDVDVPTTQYNPRTDYALFEGDRYTMRDIGFAIESKFIGATWLDFYERYILPSVAEHIRYNAVVESVDYTADAVVVRTREAAYTSKRVVVTVPVKQLQRSAIAFSPPLPGWKQTAIDRVRVWDGCKAFIEFSKTFYPAAVAFEITPETAGQKLYYDAAYGQRVDRHVLGLFAVGTGTLPYVTLDDDALIAYMLAELDALFEGQASRHYLQHTFQNWNTEPFINGAYVVSHENWRRVRTLGKRVGERLYFAGTAYTEGDDWSSVHTAARSAARAVREMLGA
ncbi:MAG: FAD-dependent oxidoreductase [Pseudomonadota bacterium]